MECRPAAGIDEGDGRAAHRPGNAGLGRRG